MKATRETKMSHNCRNFLLAFLFFLPAYIGSGAAQTDGSFAKAGSPTTTWERDGQHDFDFALGSWKAHLKRLEHPLTGSKTWVEFDGTFVARKVWKGRAMIEEVELESPDGHIEGLTLRLYNAQTHQWSIYWSNSKNGAMDPSPQVGHFKNGHGEFYGTDIVNGKLIYVRFVWTNTNTNTPHFEQSYSDDGGKTWEVNWITDQTRIGDSLDKPL
ncbi:MAG TPA: hypothetical protein VJQ54_00965 [Candidatus Sulfotelmatobacter sp.]|nr:hypothetical protein [Candidatus Sulfotelmatobacter sp.]